MKTIQHILEKKGSKVYVLNAENTVFEALELMMAQNISAILITENKVLKGIFTERDYARKVILLGKSSKETPLQIAMTANPHSITCQETISACMNLMTDNHYRHLPVVEDGILVGMISIGDVVKSIIQEQQDALDHLQNYLHS